MRLLKTTLALALVLMLAACVARQEKAAAPQAKPMDDAQIMESLAGPVWVAEYIHGKPVIDMSHTSMVFTADGSVAGSGGCNNFKGGYTIKDGKISFTPLATTMKMCAKALSDQEYRFFQSLSEPQAVAFENGLLKFVPEEGDATIFAPHEME